MSVDIEIKSNEDFILDFKLENEDGTPISELEGATAVLHIKASNLSTETLATATGLITAPEGLVQFTVPDAEISAMLADGDMRRSVVYGTRITYADETDEEPVSGRLKILRGVV